MSNSELRVTLPCGIIMPMGGFSNVTLRVESHTPLWDYGTKMPMGGGALFGAEGLSNKLNNPFVGEIQSVRLSTCISNSILVKCFVDLSMGERGGSALWEFRTD